MRILLVEDDINLCGLVAEQLRSRGYLVDCCHSGEDGLEFALSPCYNLIILDRMLPVIDGISILTNIRGQGISTPVLLLTALGSINNRIEGLDSGADDYIAKPFDMNELLARVRCLLRRPQALSDAVLSYKDLLLEQSDYILKCSNSSCTLSKREAELLSFFLQNAEKVLERERLIIQAWGPYSGIESGNLDNYIYFLRRRLKLLKSSVIIKTIYGVGYRMEDTNVQ